MKMGPHALDVLNGVCGFDRSPLGNDLEGRRDAGIEFAAAAAGTRQPRVGVDDAESQAVRRVGSSSCELTAAADAWLAEAESVGLLVEFELAALQAAVRDAGLTPASAFIVVHVSPTTVLAPKYHEAVLKAVTDTVRHIEVDLSGTVFLDSCGLGTLVALRKVVGPRGGVVRLLNLAPPVQQPNPFGPFGRNAVPTLN